MGLRFGSGGMGGEFGYDALPTLAPAERGCYTETHFMQDKFPNDEDGAALARLEADGVDLSVSRLIEFTIDAPETDSAERIAQLARDAGYEATVEYDVGEPEGDEDDDELGPSWTVYVAVEMVPQHAALVRIQDELGRLARPHGGACDGWGTAVDAPEGAE